MMQTVSRCHFCNQASPSDYRALIIGSRWIAVLARADQGSRGWIGRSFIYTKEHYNEEEVVDFLAEKHQIQMILKMAFQRLLGLSRLDVSETSSTSLHSQSSSSIPAAHPYSHIYPRYEKPVTWREYRYLDRTYRNEKDLKTKPTKAQELINEEDLVNKPLNNEQISILKTDIQIELVKMIFDKTLSNFYKPSWDQIKNAHPKQEVEDCYQRLLDAD